MENKSDFYNASQSRPVSSFEAALGLIEEQISLAELMQDVYNADIYDEIARIIADVYVRNPNNETRIDGEWVTYGYVKEVYSRLTYDHVREVVDNFNNCREYIKFKKAYLRTALFNICFEFHSGITNNLKAAGVI
ncbi:MAG: hypothetical protein J1E34_08890 [Oscillospiraceae bacterium]|nr:hypothetical protein [Oscillospiraceae bacterium]